MRRTPTLESQHADWLRPLAEKTGVKLEELRARHEALNARITKDWNRTVPGADAAVVEFIFKATEAAKRKLRRRQEGFERKGRGWTAFQTATPFWILTYYSIRAELFARECNAELLGWEFIEDPFATRTPPSLTQTPS